MPSRFAFPSHTVQLWRPLQLDPLAVSVASTNYRAIARLRPGVTINGAQRDLARALDHTVDRYPSAGLGMSTRQFFEQTNPRISVHPMRDDVIGSIADVLWILVGTALLVLAIACANVANLFLVRAESRQRDMAVRVALGAGRAAILGRFVGEGIVLASASAVLGLVLTLIGVRVLVRAGPFDIPRLNEIAVNGVTLAGMVMLTALVAFTCSGLPMLQFRARNLIGALKSSGRGATSTRKRQRVRHMLVVAQVALAFVLLVGSALLAKSFREMRAVHPGFDPSNVLALRVALPQATYPRIDDATRFYDRALESMRRLPGVRSAGASWLLPFAPQGQATSSFWVEGNAAPLGFPVVISVVAGDYFTAMGIPTLAGSTFSTAHSGRPLTEVIVSAQFARHVWGDSTGQSSVGRRIRPTPTSEWYTVVGVVGSVRGTSLMQPPDEGVYLPMTSPWVATGVAYAGHAVSDLPPYTMSLVLRSAIDPVTLAQDARRAIADLDPSLPVFSLRPMHDIVDESMARVTFSALLLGVAAGMALVLGVIGIYGVVAYTASLRTPEIGLRLALGARPGDVIRLMTRQGAMLASIGLGIGLAITLSLTRFLRAFLFGVSTTDPIVLGGMALVLGTITILASWVPARRAGRVNPAQVLAGE